MTPGSDHLLGDVCRHRTAGLGWADEPGTAAAGLYNRGRSAVADSFGSGVAEAVLACDRRGAYPHYRNTEIGTHRNCLPSD